MGERPGWRLLPDAVAGKILWSDQLRLLDRLRCQEVCTAWKTLLSECPSEVRRTGLSHELCIVFVKANIVQKHITVQLEQESPTISVKAREQACFFHCQRLLFCMLPVATAASTCIQEGTAA